MKRRFYRNKDKYILYLVVGIMILAGIFTFISQRNLNKLTVYNSSDKVEESSDKKETELDIDMSIYTNEKSGYSISIPADWQQVTKNGYTTFVHAASGSSLQIQELAYDPAINNVTSDLLSTEVAASGNTFVNFKRNTSSSYELMYQDFQNSTYDYIEEVYWDRNRIIKLVCTFNDENYKKILPYYEKIIGTFSWTKESEIPSDYYLYYNDSAKFEVGIPSSWTMSQAENTIIAMAGDTNASLSISVIGNTSYLDSITATDMASLLKNGKSNFIMQNYDNSSKEKATVSCTYVANDIQLNNKTYVFANGTYLYFLSIDYESGSIESEVPETCASLFRDFVSKQSAE